MWKLPVDQDDMTLAVATILSAVAISLVFM